MELPAGGVACGVLLDGNVVLTCQHVLPSRWVARTAIARLGTSALRFDPGRLWVDEALDCAVVGLTSPTAGGVVDFAEPVVGEEVVIVQPLAGGPRLRPTRITEVTGAFVQYAAATPYGCSGAPIFNRGWELVAVHQRRGRGLRVCGAHVEPLWRVVRDGGGLTLGRGFDECADLDLRPRE